MVKVKLTTKADNDLLVVGLVSVSKRLQILSSHNQIDTTALLATLVAMGATGKADEVIKIPGTNTRLLIFTGLGEHKATFDDETLRRAARAAGRRRPPPRSASWRGAATPRWPARIQFALLANEKTAAFDSSIPLGRIAL